MSNKRNDTEPIKEQDYGDLVGDIGKLLEAARRTTARSVNAIMTATYWEVGRRIVEFEQRGAERAPYGSELLKRLSAELTTRFGRGFSRDNLERFRLFYLRFSLDSISATVSRKSSDGLLQATTTEKSATLSRRSPDEGDADKRATVSLVSDERGER